MTIPLAMTASTPMVSSTCSQVPGPHEPGEASGRSSPDPPAPAASPPAPCPGCSGGASVLGGTCSPLPVPLLMAAVGSLCRSRRRPGGAQVSPDPHLLPKALSCPQACSTPGSEPLNLGLRLGPPSYSHLSLPLPIASTPPLCPSLTPGHLREDSLGDRGHIIVLLSVPAPSCWTPPSSSSLLSEPSSSAWAPRGRRSFSRLPQGARQLLFGAQPPQADSQPREGLGAVWGVRGLVSERSFQGNQHDLVPAALAAPSPARGPVPLDTQSGP